MDVINLAEGGAGFAGGTYTEVNGADISTSTIKLAVGTASASGGDWRAPDVDDPQIDKNTRKVRLAIGGSGVVPADSAHTFLWGQFTDQSEIIIARLCQIPIIFP